jgi:hypothetical protein
MDLFRRFQLIKKRGEGSLPFTVSKVPLPPPKMREQLRFCKLSPPKLLKTRPESGRDCLDLSSLFITLEPRVE